MDASVETAIAGMAFEEALKELETIIEQLDTGSVSLERAIVIYERAEALKAHCNRLLQEAEGRLQKIILKNENEVNFSEGEDI